MIYVKQSFDLDPASPATRDRFIEVVNRHVLPANARYGAQLVAGFFAHEEWYNQVIHLTGFEDLAAYEAFRAAMAQDQDARAGISQLTELAPGQRIDFLEPLGPVQPERLQRAISDSQEKPVGVYTFAILDVTPSKMAAFTALLEGAAQRLPIIAALRDVSGHPFRVTDLWATDTGAQGYVPNSDAQEAFFGPLRQVAPRERMMRLHVMPYSPLR